MSKVHGQGGHGRSAREKRSVLGHMRRAQERIERKHASLVRKVETRSKREVEALDSFAAKKIEGFRTAFQQHRMTRNMALVAMLGVQEWLNQMALSAMQPQKRLIFWENSGKAGLPN